MIQVWYKHLNDFWKWRLILVDCDHLLQVNDKPATITLANKVMHVLNEHVSESTQLKTLSIEIKN